MDFTKFLSRKWLSTIFAIIVNILLAQSTELDPEIKKLLMQLVSILTGAYVSVEGINDIIKK
jgi:hypothetical protein